MKTSDCLNLSIEDDFFNDLSGEYEIPSFEKYTENIISKEEANEELSKNEKYFKNLMRMEKIKDVKKPKTTKTKDKKESYSFIKLFDEHRKEFKTVKKSWWHEEYERCYAVCNKKEEKIDEKPEEKKRTRKKVKTCFSKFQPPPTSESVIKKELNRALNNCLKMWIRKQKKTTNFKDPL